ncbi:MAG: PDZ domain-containing protein [Gammaproteobacteria bacterium]
MIQYRIQPLAPQAHIFAVELTISEPDSGGQLLTLPAWIPGSYMIRDFARNIVKLEASSSGASIGVEKADKQTWQCEPCSGELVITYQVYAWDLSVRGAHLDVTHGYFNGTSLFLRVVGCEDRPCDVVIQAPQGDDYGDWRVATTLPRKDAEHLGFGSYQASNYDELIDHPVEMGHFTHARFDLYGTPHEIAISGRHNCDMERLCRDLKKICETHVEMFGELPQMERYLFQVMAVGDGYGGLEHRTSTSLICKRGDLPQPGVQEITEEYRQFLGLCSHEYFHLWNVKRIRPAAFKSADLGSEAYSRLLWAFEGITSYYDDLALVRSGLIDAEGYLELLGQTITRVVRGSGRLKQTVQESSFDAWIKFYKQDENAPNSIVSYYTKGALIALSLDLTIRRATSGAKSLDDLMRALGLRYGKPDIGVGEADIETLAAEVTGLDLTEFFDQALRSTDDLPLGGILQQFALGYELRPAKNSKDRGGLRKEQQPPRPTPDLGVIHKPDAAGALLTAVMDSGPAREAGLSAGDILIALDGIRVTSENLDQLLARARIGEHLTVHAFRRDELMQFQVAMKPAEPNTCVLWLESGVESEQYVGLQAWLQLTK